MKTLDHDVYCYFCRKKIQEFQFIFVERGVWRGVAYIVCKRCYEEQKALYGDNFLDLIKPRKYQESRR